MNATLSGTARRVPGDHTRRQIRDVSLFWLNYRHPNGRFAGAAVIEASALISARSPHGATEELLVLAHGFDSDTIAGLVRTGLATAQRESMKAGSKTIEVVRIRITDAGRRAIEG
jgi:hypothetical protein